MGEGSDVCESTIMKEKNLQRNMGLMEGQAPRGYKVGQFETGYCFGIKIFGANNCLETEASRLAQQMVSHFRANTQSPQGLGN